MTAVGGSVEGLAALALLALATAACIALALARSLVSMAFSFAAFAAAVSGVLAVLAGTATGFVSLTLLGAAAPVAALGAIALTRTTARPRTDGRPWAALAGVGVLAVALGFAASDAAPLAALAPAQPVSRAAAAAGAAALSIGCLAVYALLGLGERSGLRDDGQRRGSRR